MSSQDGISETALQRRKVVGRCPKCLLEFITKSGYDRHMQRDNCGERNNPMSLVKKEKTIPCPKCLMMFITRDGCRRHMLSKNCKERDTETIPQKKEVVETCPKCSQKFTTLRGFRRHTRKDSCQNRKNRTTLPDKEKMMCPKCLRKFITPGGLRRHKLRDKCEEANVPSPLRRKKKTLRDHKRTCPNCLLKFTTVAACRLHRLKCACQLDPEQFSTAKQLCMNFRKICPVCFAEFAVARSVTNHLRRYGSDLAKNKNNRHQAMVEALARQKCRQCSNDFDNIDVFFNHVKEFHGSIGSTGKVEFECSNCLGTFHTMTKFLHHDNKACDQSEPAQNGNPSLTDVRPHIEINVDWIRENKNDQTLPQIEKEAGAKMGNLTLTESMLKKMLGNQSKHPTNLSTLRKSKLLNCHICHCTFVTKAALIRHKSTVCWRIQRGECVKTLYARLQKSKKVCPICYMEFKDGNYLRGHLRHYKWNQYRDAIARTKAAAEASIRQKCRKCNIEFEDVAKFREHVNGSHGVLTSVTKHGQWQVGYQCKKCMQNFFTMSKYLHHDETTCQRDETINLRSPTFVDTQVQIKFSVDTNIDENNTTDPWSSNKVEPRKTCPVCYQQLKYWTSLRRHLRDRKCNQYNNADGRKAIVEAALRQKCRRCNIDFYNINTFRNHVNNAHGTRKRGSRIEYKCDKCMKIFKWMPTYLHHDENKCQAMGNNNQSSASPNQVLQPSLDDEVTIQPKIEKRSTCTHCLKTFQTVRGLLRHCRISMHQSLEPTVKNVETDRFIKVCPFCYNEFKAMDDLNSHLQENGSDLCTDRNVVIEASLQKKCRFCTISFDNLDEFLHHIDATHGSRSNDDERVQYTCDKCEAVFKDKSEYLHHNNRVCRLLKKFYATTCAKCLEQFEEKSDYLVHVGNDKCAQTYYPIVKDVLEVHRALAVINQKRRRKLLRINSLVDTYTQHSLPSDLTAEKVVLRVIFINVQGLTTKKIDELRVIHQKTSADVICLSEVSSGGYVYVEDYIKGLLADTFEEFCLHYIPCHCIRTNSFAGYHGMAMLVNKNMKSCMQEVELKECGVTDHRQLCVDITTPNGNAIRVVSVHYKSSSSTMKEGAFKRVQMHSTVEVLSNAPDGATLIVGGDVNMHPEWRQFGEMIHIFESAKLVPVSVLSLWDPNSNSKTWTHTRDSKTPGNMLDHAFVRSSFDVSARLLKPPDYRVSTDHPNFLEITLFNREPRPTKKIRFIQPRCKDCGRCYISKNRIHRPCPFKWPNLLETLAVGLPPHSDRAKATKVFKTRQASVMIKRNKQLFEILDQEKP